MRWVMYPLNIKLHIYKSNIPIIFGGILVNSMEEHQNRS